MSLNEFFFAYKTVNKYRIYLKPFPIDPPTRLIPKLTICASHITVQSTLQVGSYSDLYAKGNTFRIPYCYHMIVFMHVSFRLRVSCVFGGPHTNCSKKIRHFLQTPLGWQQNKHHSF